MAYLLRKCIFQGRSNGFLSAIFLDTCVQRSSFFSTVCSCRPKNYEALRTQTCLRISTRRMAGHSKWQNIRHIKAAKDGEKKKTAEKLVQRIKIAIQEGGSADPKFNSRLAAILQEGKEHNVPNATMDNAIKGIEKSKANGKQLYVEAMGPGNCMMIIDTFTDKPKWLRQELTNIMKKFGCRIGEAGFAAHSFDFKGIVQTKLTESVDLEAATEAAIEVGAEDVEETTNDDEEKVLQFICDPKELHKVKTNLEAMNYSVNISRMQYIPTLMTPLSKDHLNVVDDLITALENHESVMRIYDNIEAAS